MKKPTFMRGVILAFGFALVSAVAYAGLRALFAPQLLCAILITALSGAYTLYLLATSRSKTGRLSTVIAWLLCASAGALFTTSLAQLLVGHLLAIWLVRAFFHQRSIALALVDLVLCALGALVAVLTALHSASVFLSVWVFFLIQSLFVALHGQTANRNEAVGAAAPDRFDRALRTAEGAIRRLHSA